MPGIAGDGSEDLPNRKSEIARYDCEMTSDFYENRYAEMTSYELGEYVRFEDHMEAMREATAPKPPAQDYLKQKLDTAYGELKIITDNIQLLKPHHVRKLIELNSMIGNILVWQSMDQYEKEHDGPREV